MKRLFEIGTYSKFWWKMQCFLGGGDYWIITVCIALHKICQNTGFLWLVFSHIRTETKVLPLYGKMRVRQNPYCGVFYTVLSNRIYFCVWGFWNGVLLLATGASAGLDIYKRELGCKEETPQLQKNINKINTKQAELVEMKDDINLRWVPGKHLFILLGTKPKFEFHLLNHLLDIKFFCIKKYFFHQYNYFFENDT